MKKYIVILILICNSALGQNQPIFGVNIGGTFANIRGNVYANKNEYKSNFLVGASVELTLNECFALIGNLNYERKSFGQTRNVINFDDFDPIVGSKNIDVNLRFEYLTIPVNMKYYVDTQKRFFVNGGPFAGILLNSNSFVDGNKSSEKQFIKPLDFGLNLGVGTLIKITENYDLNLELRHNLGLSNVSKVSTINDNGLKTNSFNLIANWQFN